MHGEEISLNGLLFCPVCYECLGMHVADIQLHLAGAHPYTKLGALCRLMFYPPTVIIVGEILEGGDFDE